MKTKLFFILWFLPYLLYAQNYESGQIKFRIIDEELLEDLKVNTSINALKQNQIMDEIVTNFNISSIEKLYPAAYEIAENDLAENLQAYFILQSSSDETNLLNELQEEAYEIVDNVNLIMILEPLYTPDDYALYWGQCNLDLMNVEEAWDITTGSTDIKIAIIECCNGFNTTHEDLSSQVTYTQPGIDLAEYLDIESHGNKVAGCAAAATDNGVGIAGIGFNSELWLYTGGYPEILDAAVRGAQVINCSWMSCYSDPDNEAVIELVTDMGSIVVAGAGNGTAAAHCSGGPGVGSGNNGYGYPASYDRVISVSSCTCDDNLEASGVWHAFNDKVDIVTQGYNAVTTDIPG